MLAAAGHRVAGADQSAGMLPRAQARGIAFSLERASLQDLSYAGRFDAVLTIDAMEHIPPGDRPGVLARLRRAVRPGGLVYVTAGNCGGAIPSGPSRAFPHAGCRRCGGLAEPDAAGVLPLLPGP